MSSFRRNIALGTTLGDCSTTEALRAPWFVDESVFRLLAPTLSYAVTVVGRSSKSKKELRGCFRGDGSPSEGVYVLEAEKIPLELSNGFWWSHGDGRKAGWV